MSRQKPVVRRYFLSGTISRRPISCLPCELWLWDAQPDAKGTTILGFTAADAIDLGRIDANALTGGLQTFTLVGRGMADGVGGLAFSHKKEAGHDMTAITGNTGTGAFKLKLQGHHDLRSDQFSF